MTNWAELTNKTIELEPKVKQITRDWFKENPDWSGWVEFANYPPVFIGRFEIIHINKLSDIRLGEAEKIATKICNECGLLGKRFWKGEPSKNRIEYKFWLPIK